MARYVSQLARRIDNLVEAIAIGKFHASMKDRLTELEGRKAELEAEIEELGNEAPIRLHPGLARVYRKKVATLTEALDTPETRLEAAEILRGLLSEIRLVPEEAGHTIELVGALASILALRELESKQPRAGGIGAGSRTLVAGAGFEPATFRL